MWELATKSEGIPLEELFIDKNVDETVRDLGTKSEDIPPNEIFIEKMLMRQ